MKIVVGLSGSPACPDVLDAALDEGVARGLPVEAMAIWNVRGTPAYAGLGEVPMACEKAEQRAAHDLFGLVHAARESREQMPEITMEVLHGHPGPALLEHVGPGDLLFVGGPQHGIMHHDLHSVSAYAVHHATCEVIVVPTPPHPAHRWHLRERLHLTRH